MKRFLAISCAALMCVALVGLAACGSSISQGAKDNFAGEWKLAGAEGAGVTFAGDFQAMFGDQEAITLTLNDDGTGAIAFDDQSADLKWEAQDDTNITLTAQAEQLDKLTVSGGERSDDNKTVAIKGSFADGAVTLELGNGSYASKMIFTKDGEMKGLPELSTENAEKVTKESQLKGTWTLTGVAIEDMIMTGASTDLASLINSDDVQMEFKDDGVASVMGQDFKYKVTDDGASVTMADTDIPVKMLEGDLLLESQEDDTGINMVERFAKE